MSDQFPERWREIVEDPYVDAINRSMFRLFSTVLPGMLVVTGPDCDGRILTKYSEKFIKERSNLVREKDDYLFATYGLKPNIDTFEELNNSGVPSREINIDTTSTENTK